jgi:predicted Zn-dependent protease with MMP-like domain
MLSLFQAETLARRAIDKALSGLPAEIREAAMDCRIDFLPYPEPEQIVNEGDEDLLGLFEGFSRMDPLPGSPDEMPRISLFLGNLVEMVDHDREAFREEVAITFLHELGHYLGMDEDQVEELGLG